MCIRDRSNIGFVAFPKIKPDMPFYEDVCTDCIMIPSKAKNPEVAKEMLAFLATRESMQKLVESVAVVWSKEVEYTKEVDFAKLKVLENAKGAAQFFDRDSPPAFYEKAMDYLVMFMDHPEKLDDILASLEELRRQVYE